jgi:hypothetical protein
MLDANGKILATHHCLWIPPHGNCGCGCGPNSPHVPLDREPWLDFQEALEWPGDEVASIAFHRGGKAFFTIPVGEAPTVSIEGPERREGSLVVSVDTGHTREQVSVAVLFSSDDGVTWQPVATDPPNGQVEIAGDRLAGGERCRFRAIATAALRSATADTNRLQLIVRRGFYSLPFDHARFCLGR